MRSKASSAIPGSGSLGADERKPGVSQSIDHFIDVILEPTREIDPLDFDGQCRLLEGLLVMRQRIMIQRKTSRAGFLTPAPRLTFHQRPNWLANRPKTPPRLGHPFTLPHTQIA